MMNIVAIDPSLTCTAVVINGQRFVFASDNMAHTKKGALTRWFKECEGLVEYVFTDYKHLDEYSDNEVSKLLAYLKTVTRIKETIVKHATPNILAPHKDPHFDINEHTDRSLLKRPIKILIEGYSYSSAAGPLIDLVTFSTLLRKAMLELTNDVTILAPTQLKLKAAEMVYEPIKKGKKVIKYEYRNHEGVAGGQFKKPDMMQALIDCEKFSNSWVHFLKSNREELLGYKSVPKPIEDINDAMLLYYVGLQSE